VIVKALSSRSRNLGYGWSTRTTDVNGTWRLVPPTEPSATGGLRTVNAEIDRRNLICGNGTYFSDSLFVGGMPVMEYRDYCGVWQSAGGRLDHIMSLVGDGLFVEVKLAETEDEAEEVRAAWRDAVWN